MRVSAALLLVLALAACASRAELKPKEGHALPPAPYGREERPTPTHMLEVPTQAQPQRSVELRKKSEERADDPFDLPPPEEAAPN